MSSDCTLKTKMLQLCLLLFFFSQLIMLKILGKIMLFFFSPVVALNLFPVFCPHAVMVSPPGPVLKRQKKDTVPHSVFTIPPELDVSLLLEFVGWASLGTVHRLFILYAPFSQLTFWLIMAENAEAKVELFIFWLVHTGVIYGKYPSSYCFMHSWISDPVASV